MLSWSVGGKKSVFIIPAAIEPILKANIHQKATTTKNALFLPFRKNPVNFQSSSEALSSFTHK